MYGNVFFQPKKALTCSPSEAKADAGSTVVGAVRRLISGDVDVCGRTLVSISLDTGEEVNFTVPRSVLTGPESPIKAVPSARQKPSVSSVSTRLHWGHRFVQAGSG